LSDSESEELSPIDAGLDRDRLACIQAGVYGLVANFRWWKMSKY
jgi:hypothetical protein